MTNRKSHMQKNQLITIVVAAAIVGGIAGFNSVRREGRAAITERSIPEKFDYGTWTDNTYRNGFFGFSFSVPENWFVADDGEIAMIFNLAKNAVEAGNKDLRKIMNVAEITTANMIFTSRHSPTEAAIMEIPSNPNIVLTAENLNKVKIDLARYAKLNRQNYLKIMPGAVIKNESVKNIGGKRFASKESEFEAFGMMIRQKCLILVENGFGLVFSMTFFNDDEERLLDAIMETMVWE